MIPLVEFDPIPHAYKVNGRSVPSVTQVLGLLEDWSHVDPELLLRAQVFGQNVHEAVHLFSMGTLDWQHLDPNLKPYVDQFARFLVDTNSDVLASELRVGSQRYGYAGTLDLIIDWRRKRHVLCDLKSGLVPKRTVGPQTAGYAEAAKEGFWPRPLLHRGVLKLQSDRYKFEPMKDKGDFNRFLSCLNAWRVRNG